MEGDAVFESKGASLKAKSGDLMLCPKNCAYNIDGGKEKLITIHFDTNAKLPKSLKKLSVSNPEIFERDFSRLYSAWSSKRIGFEHECKYILYKIFMNTERETAEKCGFENVYYFSLFIKKETGKTPSQFVDK